MGLLDNLTGALGGEAGGGDLMGMLSGLAGGGKEQSPMLGMALKLIEQNGGLPAIVEKLRAAGLGAQVESWIGTGANLPVSGEQITSALGSGALGPLASLLGGEGAASNALATMLPNVVNTMTPSGSVPQNHGDLLSQAMQMFGK